MYTINIIVQYVEFLMEFEWRNPLKVWRAYLIDSDFKAVPALIRRTGARGRFDNNLISQHLDKSINLFSLFTSTLEVCMNGCSGLASRSKFTLMLTTWVNGPAPNSNGAWTADDLDITPAFQFTVSPKVSTNTYNTRFAFRPIIPSSVMSSSLASKIFDHVYVVFQSLKFILK